jgi:hypothetical protein
MFLSSLHWLRGHSKPYQTLAAMSPAVTGICLQPTRLVLLQAQQPAAAASSRGGGISRRCFGGRGALTDAVATAPGVDVGHEVAANQVAHRQGVRGYHHQTLGGAVAAAGAGPALQQSAACKQPNVQSTAMTWYC